MDIEKSKRINLLLDIYRNLLTSKQQEMMDYYYADDFSLSEIANNMKVSRTAVFDLIKRTTTLLENYESKLHIFKLKEKIMAEIQDLDESKRKKIEQILQDGE